MRILFDQGTPVPRRRHLAEHHVETAYERGWSTLKNGDLLDSAEREVFEMLVTTDQNLRYQQRLTQRRLAIVVLTTTNWPRLRQNLDAVIRGIEAAPDLGYVEIAIL